MRAAAALRVKQERIMCPFIGFPELPFEPQPSSSPVSAPIPPGSPRYSDRLGVSITRVTRPNTRVPSLFGCRFTFPGHVGHNSFFRREARFESKRGRVQVVVPRTILRLRQNEVFLRPDHGFRVIGQTLEGMTARAVSWTVEKALQSLRPGAAWQAGTPSPSSGGASFHPPGTALERHHGQRGHMEELAPPATPPIRRPPSGEKEIAKCRTCHIISRNTTLPATPFSSRALCHGRSSQPPSLPDEPVWTA
jgi:hypothetical protein